MKSFSQCNCFRTFCYCKPRRCLRGPLSHQCACFLQRELYSQGVYVWVWGSKHRDFRMTLESHASRSLVFSLSVSYQNHQTIIFEREVSYGSVESHSQGTRCHSVQHRQTYTSHTDRQRHNMLLSAAFSHGLQWAHTQPMTHTHIRTTTETNRVDRERERALGTW